MLDLNRPIYRPIAAYGHFGRDDLDLTWERTDRAQAPTDAPRSCKYRRGNKMSALPTEVLNGDYKIKDLSLQIGAAERSA